MMPSSRPKSEVQRVAIIGTGISGMAAAYFLNRVAEVTVFEKEGRPGGHANTVDVSEDGRKIPIDTGFIVYNRHTYPYFCKLMEELGVETQDSNMSFSVKGRMSGLEYCGTGFKTIFAQKRNFLRPWFYKMLLEIVRFNREGNRMLQAGTRTGHSLGQYLEEGRYSRPFIDYYVIPMGAAIWSTPASRMTEFPLHAFLRFLSNHGMLGVTTHFQWRTVRGGSREYVRKITAPYADRILYDSAVRSVTRDPEAVRVRLENGKTFSFDQVVLATHADDTLRLLADASAGEKGLLSLFAYQPNRVELHSDAGVLPARVAAHAAWNYEVDEGDPDPAPRLHYSMNRLQNLPSSKPYVVTLNPAPGAPAADVHYSKEYEHPLYSIEGIRRQQEIIALNGTNRTYFCGAYCGYGFHEDGLRSAVEVARHFGVEF
jgi:predicted NAD/FAD-binding protein